jgi:WD40 repeat protein
VQIPASYRFAPAVTSVALSPDGKLIAAACRSEVVLIETETEVTPRRIATQSDLVAHVEFSPDGSLIAAVGGSPGRFGEVRFIKTADGSVASQRRIGHDSLFRGNFSPDGTAIAVGGPDGAVHIVPVNAAAEVRRLELHSDWVLDVAYSPDGKLLVSGGRDKAVKVASVETGRLIRAIDASTDWVWAVAASEQFAVASGRSRKLVGYEFKTALEGAELTGGGNEARPVNRRDQYAKAFEDQSEEVLDLATSGDRKLLAVAGAFAEVRVYRMADRARVATVPNLLPPVYSLALNADGSRLAVGTKSGLVQLFELPTAKLLKTIAPVPVAASTAAK